MHRPCAAQPAPKLPVNQTLNPTLKYPQPPSIKITIHLLPDTTSGGFWISFRTIGTNSMQNNISIGRAKIIWQPWSQSDSSGNLFFNIAFIKAIPLDLYMLTLQTLVIAYLLFTSHGTIAYICRNSVVTFDKLHVFHYSYFKHLISQQYKSS